MESIRVPLGGSGRGVARRTIPLLMVAKPVSPWFQPTRCNRPTPAGRPGPLRVRHSIKVCHPSGNPSQIATLASILGPPRKCKGGAKRRRNGSQGVTGSEAWERLRNSELLRLQKQQDRKRYRQTKKNFEHTDDYVHLTFDEREQFVLEIADLCAYGLRRHLENGEAEIFHRVFQRADRRGDVAVGVRHFTSMSCNCKIRNSSAI